VKKSVKVASAENSKAKEKNKTLQKLKADRDRKRDMKKQGGLAPRTVLVLAFSERASSVQVKAQLVEHCASFLDQPGPVTVSPPSLSKRSKFTFMAVDATSVFDVLEACLISDILVPVIDAVEGVSATGVRLASVIKAQGLMTVLPVITGIARVPDKIRHATKKGLLADLQYLFPNVARVLPADEADGDLLQIFRFLDAARLTELHFQAPRSFVLAEKVSLVCGG
jgi:hypothetical protein